MKHHAYYMKEALKEAAKAEKKDEVPVGAVIVSGGKIIARGHNLIRSKKDPSAHAEMIAIKKAAKKLNNERLNGCALYVTLEPCSMCAGAIILSRIKLVVYGTKDPKTGACGSMISLLQHEKHNHKVEVHNGVLEQECGDILKEFFKGKRLKRN
ncbi:MAG: tRNA-specific adenosine deaminase [Candidatus Aerophobetes bacterium ADurb.Bin490]|nr:MAG: tRNA-specific adenosine deaminase [Candidatus Aerophobetes bacterium ADurb.Bin490]